MSSATAVAAETALPDSQARLDAALRDLAHRRRAWAQTATAERVALLGKVKEATYATAKAWAELGAEKKGLAKGSPLAGEEWTSGPWALLAALDNYRFTLAHLSGAEHIANLKTRVGPSQQTIVRVFPHSLFDRLLLSGVSAEVWMEPGVTPAKLPLTTASAYRDMPAARSGKVSLVLGAGNISAISPLDVLHKLIAEHAVVILKLNPVNDYLYDVLSRALAPLVEAGFLRIVRGGAEVGQYLCNHRLVEDIHITGSALSHDAIVFGTGAQGRRRKEANDPINWRPITSELGAVCPTIVVPGPWSAADLRFQAEHVATQKLHNAGFNCIACQILLLPEIWPQRERFQAELRRALSEVPGRPLYYPGAEKRLADFASHYPDADRVPARQSDQARILVSLPKPEADDPHALQCEVFAPALGEVLLRADGAEGYLRRAVRYCNDELQGTLGANILIHPKTLKALGPRFEEILSELRYGSIAVNAWTGLGFLLTRTPWGAFPGHKLNDIQSGRGFVHNTLLFDRAERSVVYGPFRPFPRSLLHGAMTLLPRPPWFVTNRRADRIGRRLVEFQHRPSWLKLPGIFFDALLG
jgi:acyl-CoA reductase-like NAD-dependent aldehyde dehydrogenase